jgi:hypothetical protein
MAECCNKREDYSMWPFIQKSPEAKLAPTKEERDKAERSFELALGKASAIPSATMVCHRDTWRLADSWARSRATYAPPSPNRITELPDGMREIQLTGRNLVTLLFATWDMGSSPSTGAANLTIAARIFTAIAEAVNSADMNVNGGSMARPIIIDAAP